MYSGRDEHKRRRRCILSYTEGEEAPEQQESSKKSSARRRREPAALAAKRDEATPQIEEAMTSPALKLEEKAPAKSAKSEKSSEERTAKRRKRAIEGQPLEPIPHFTTVLARIRFPGGSRAIRLRDALGPIYQDPYFTHLFPMSKNDTEAPWRLAIITILQALETLSDQQAVECVRADMDWKYALSLPAEEHYITINTLVQFRNRLREPEVQEQVLKPLLKVCRRQGWLRVLGKQSIDSNTILEIIERINILESMLNILGAVLEMINGVGETIGMTEEVGLEHMVKLIRIDWLNRYVYRMKPREVPRERHAQLALFEQVGLDARMLLGAINADETPYFIRTLPMVKMLQKLWDVHYGQSSQDLLAENRQNKQDEHNRRREPQQRMEGV